MTKIGLLEQKFAGKRNAFHSPESKPWIQHSTGKMSRSPQDQAIPSMEFSPLDILMGLQIMEDQRKCDQNLTNYDAVSSLMKN